MEQNTIVLGEITYTISRSFDNGRTASELLTEYLTKEIRKDAHP